MKTRIYTERIEHCMFCPKVTNDKERCLALGEHHLRAVPVRGTPDWCPLPEDEPRPPQGATMGDEL